MIPVFQFKDPNSKYWVEVFPIDHEIRRNQSEQSRIFLKQKLAELSSAEIQFDIRGEGKPILKNFPVKIDFNISHTDRFIALAFSTKGHVGVDIEPIRQSQNLQGIMEKVFNPEEISFVNHSTQVAESFTKIWSSKEAVIKAAAGGVFKHALKIHLDIDQQKVVKIPKDFGSAQDWEIKIFENIPGYVLSLAFTESI